MKRALVSRVVDALVAALRTIGKTTDTHSHPVTVDRSIGLPHWDAVARPAILVLEPAWEDFRIGSADEVGTATLAIEIEVLAGETGFGSKVADQVHGLCEDILRVLRSNYRLVDDDPDAPTLVLALTPARMEWDEPLMAMSQVASATVRVDARIEFRKGE